MTSTAESEYWKQSELSDKSNASPLLGNIFPTSTGIIHFIGVGGIGMSGIVEILNSLDYKIQGSDISENYVIDRLKRIGIKIFPRHEALNIKEASLVVKSTAIKDTNPEIIAAKELNIPIIKRSEMLAELMRFKHSISVSGTHGKTTTTSLIANLFEKAGLNPTVINGGIINTRNTNAYLGDSEYLIAEADESDGTFIKVPSYVGIITNIDPEHLDYYGTFENSIAAYRTFITNLPFYGFGVLCYDHPVVRQLGDSIKERRIISYGIDSHDVDFRAVNISCETFGSKFDVIIAQKYKEHMKLEYDRIEGIELHIHGKHNVSNSLAAIAVGIEKGFSLVVIQNAYKNFGGVKRRFTKTGEVDGISIIDDYAHHPVEIKATLATARSIADATGGRVIAVMQPHRYTRIHDLMNDFSLSFNDVDELLISDVYPAGEDPIPGANSKELMKRIEANSTSECKPIYLENPENLANIINKLAKPLDIVVFLGAGNITKWAYELPKNLQTLRYK
jgi:UDP-N-acetylmuramate--alanine ligase